MLYTLPYKNTVNQTATALRSYINEDKDPTPKPWTIWEAVRATPAAITIFAPFVHGAARKEIRYIDAGFGYNNPSDLVLQEGRSLWEGEGFLALNVDIGVFLSFGTGMGQVVRMDDETIVEKLSAKVQAPLKAIGVMQKIVTDTEHTHRCVALQFGSNSVKYYRFNVDHGLQDVHLFDYMKREDMEVDTDAYLDKVEVERELKRCVEVMKVLPVREQGLLDYRPGEEETIYSLGEGGSLKDQKLRARLDSLRM